MRAVSPWLRDAPRVLHCCGRLRRRRAVLHRGQPFAQPRPLTRDYDEKALVEMYRSILTRSEAGLVLAAA